MPETRELTARALATGVVLGALLAPCNVYSGLRIGWSFNMSIIALLASIALWRPLGRAFGLREWNRLESNIIEANGRDSTAAGVRIRGPVDGLVFRKNVIRDLRATNARRQSVGILIEEAAGEIKLDDNQIEAATAVEDRRNRPAK